MLNSCWNTLGSSTAIVVPYLGFWLERVTGTWTTMTVRVTHSISSCASAGCYSSANGGSASAQLITVGFKLASAALFVRWSSVETARSILARQDASEGADRLPSLASVPGGPPA